MRQIHLIDIVLRMIAIKKSDVTLQIVRKKCRNIICKIFRRCFVRKIALETVKHE